MRGSNMMSPAFALALQHLLLRIRELHEYRGSNRKGFFKKSNFLPLEAEVQRDGCIIMHFAEVASEIDDYPMTRISSNGFFYHCIEGHK